MAVATPGSGTADAVTDDVPNLTIAQTRALEKLAVAGDNGAAETLFLQGVPEHRRLHWLLLAARRGDCDAMEVAHEHYQMGKKLRASALWVANYDRAGCKNRPQQRFDRYLSQHLDLAGAAVGGDCPSQRAIAQVAAQLGAQAPNYMRRC
ncbi:MAG TPA: hypothetical protein VG166_00010 [Caulobacteraceae bacterium]|nr:hypothetical protein [Caulobacteraceae bacterium]